MVHPSREVGNILDQLFGSGLEVYRPDHPDLEAEVTQSTAQVVLYGDRL
jgi:hypothetical protein